MKTRFFCSLSEIRKGNDMIRAKHLLDGVRTLQEAATRLEAAAAEMRALAARGVRLDGPMADDYGTLVAPAALDDGNARVARRIVMGERARRRS